MVVFERQLGESGEPRRECDQRPGPRVSQHGLSAVLLGVLPYVHRPGALNVCVALPVSNHMQGQRVWK